MRTALFALIGGMIGAGVIEFATRSSNAQAQAEKMEAAIASGACQVKIGSTVSTGGTRCPRGSVVTGIWNSYIYCSEIQVSCSATQ